MPSPGGGGEAGPCLTSLHWPGLIRLEYDDEPLLPQVERWHLVAVTPLEDPAWLLVMWSAVTSTASSLTMMLCRCGTNPALDYNGAFLLSRGRTEAGLPAEAEAAFRQVAARHGVDWDSMCVSDNTQCPENP